MRHSERKATSKTQPCGNCFAFQRCDDGGRKPVHLLVGFIFLRKAREIQTFTLTGFIFSGNS
jgi:hypothetical protein